MKTYINTLLSEKGLSINTQLLQEEGQIGLTIEMLVEFIYSMPKNISSKIEMTFRKLDFCNGDIMHYVNYLAGAMVQSINK